MLGTAAEGAWATTLGPQICTADAEARLEKARSLAGHLRELSDAPLATVRKHPAWRILDSVVNQCLSYDASVSDPGAMAPLGKRLDELVATTAAHILDVRNWSPAALTQLRLSRDHGGCGIRSAEDRCLTAFLAAACRLAPATSLTDAAQQAVKAAGGAA